MKKFSCNLCGGASEATEWNKSTEEFYGEDIFLIDDDNRVGQFCYFVCPKCQGNCGEDLVSEVEHPELINS